MRRARLWLTPLALLPLLILGLWLWRDQATTIWLAGFFAACL
jgi:hypothetical protein